MPINFFNQEHSNYYNTKYEGKIYDDELVPSYERFYANLEKSENRGLELHELADLTNADLSYLTQMGVKEIAQWKTALYTQNKISEKKIAIIIHQDASNLAVPLFYEEWIAESPELIKFFSNKDEAIDWLAK
jgi:hypothetical protein